jgi:hypothetical protein
VFDFLVLLFLVPLVLLAPGIFFGSFGLIAVVWDDDKDLAWEEDGMEWRWW